MSATHLGANIKMDALTNGLSQADFALLRVLYNGGMTNILSLIGTLGGGPITATQLHSVSVERF